MHKICDFDALLTFHFSDTTVKRLKKIWKRHLSIGVNIDVTQKLSRKSSKMFNPLQLKYTWSKFNKINQVIAIFIELWNDTNIIICWTEVTNWIFL